GYELVADDDRRAGDGDRGAGQGVAGETLRGQERERMNAGRVALEQLHADSGGVDDCRRVDVDVGGERAAGQHGVDERGRGVEVVRTNIAIAGVVRGGPVAGQVDSHAAVAGDGVA